MEREYSRMPWPQKHPYLEQKRLVPPALLSSPLSRKTKPEQRKLLSSAEQRNAELSTLKTAQRKREKEW